MEDIKAKIDQFIDFFKKQLEVVGKAQFTEKGHLYKKILYVAIIDTLSKTIYPRKGNRERFVSFLENFCNWADCQKVSLIHLARLLEKVPDPEFSQLRKFVFSLFAKWNNGDEVYLDQDPDYSAIKKLWPKDKEHMKPLETVQLDSLKHGHLLYANRNSLIHELRSPGYGMEYPDDNDPLYHSMLHSDKKTWELVYPVGFFKTVCESALSNLSTYYSKNRINPYDSFCFGTYWIEELNE